MDLAIVGGTGKEGFGLALRLAAAGHAVTIGSRDAERAAAAVAEARQRLGADAAIAGALNPDAVAGKPVVVVTVPFVGQASTYEQLRDHLAPDAVVVDATSPLQSAVGGAAWHALRPWQGSAAELARSLVPPSVRLVAAFHTVSATALPRRSGV